MTGYMKTVLMIVLLLLPAGIVFPQGAGDGSVVIPFSDASRPGSLRLSLITGSISVKAHSGKEVILYTANRGDDESWQGSRRSSPDAAGLKRIPNFSTGLTIEEDNNVISINARPRPLNITLQVPSRISLNLKTINGNIEVENVQGEIEVSSINGKVMLSQVSGSVVAHALHGDVKVGMVAVEPDKPMSFSSLKGDIDVSLPPDIRANLLMKSDNGEMYSDFDIKFSQLDHSGAEDTRGQNKKYRIRMDRTTKGIVNGGGPEMQFKTLRGNIYLRKSLR